MKIKKVTFLAKSRNKHYLNDNICWSHGKDTSSVGFCLSMTKGHLRPLLYFCLNHHSRKTTNVTFTAEVMAQCSQKACCHDGKKIISKTYCQNHDHKNHQWPLAEVSAQRPLWWQYQCRCKSHDTQDNALSVFLSSIMQKLKHSC